MTERPETITSGYGKLVGSEILENIDFLNRKKINTSNPYGKNVTKKIISLLNNLNYD